MNLKKHTKSLFLFHRDLRLEDNKGLIRSLEESEMVIPAFILDPDQITDKNTYRGDHALQFMRASLHDLDHQLKGKQSRLYVFYGKTDSILHQLFKEEGIEAFYSNRDYTPFARRRDEEIRQLCEQLGIGFYLSPDSLLTEPEEVSKDDGKPYTVFTPFFRKAAMIRIHRPLNNPFYNYYKQPIASEEGNWKKRLKFDMNERLYLKGGRAEGLKLLSELCDLKQYAQTRNVPSNQKGTSRLSAHHKFGTVSIRESYFRALECFGPEHSFFAELYWRDFFTHIAFHFPQVFGHAFHQNYDAIEWNQDEKAFKKWCEGQTGFPIVDAGMRQLNETGYMHNRVRMITASFLVKDLHIDWRWGERYFAQKLIDYDPAVNNGNWQWVASTGCDAQPYFRIFNPWRQQEKFDPECQYIKQWVPELKNAEPKTIHQWHKQRGMLFEGYPPPILDHAKEQAIAKAMYKKGEV